MVAHLGKVAHAKAIVDAVNIPVLADAENGWNNSANISSGTHLRWRRLDREVPDSAA
jgi:2-methylisocitrate lyase-like PEP mutase family enzyme